MSSETAFEPTGGAALPEPRKPITMRDVAWLAGLLEGEAYFNAHGTSFTPLIKLVMTDRDVVCRVADLFGARCLREKRREQPHWKPAYSAAKAGVIAAGWMMTLYLLLGERRRTDIRRILMAWRSRPVARRFRTQCPQGHPLPKERGPNGRPRECRTCRQEASARWGRMHRRRVDTKTARLF